MNKCLLTLIAAFAMTTTYVAADNNPNANKIDEEKLKGFFSDWLKSRPLTVEVADQGKNFQVNVKTVKDMPNASDLEIANYSIMNTSGRLPGMISLVLRPAGEARVDMVGPQKGSFTFTKGGRDIGLPEAIPLGRYLLTVNGEIYGMLVVREDKTVLRQGLKPQLQPGAPEAQGGNAEEMQEPGMIPKPVQSSPNIQLTPQSQQANQEQNIPATTSAN